MAVKIITDSTSDLSNELKEKYDIDTIPLHVLMGDEEHLDGQTITPDEIYAWADKNKTTPKTSAVSYDITLEKFRKYIDEGREIVCFAISATMSTTINVMRMAAQELGAEDKIFIIDSANLSVGIGLMVLRAAELSLEGKSAKEICDEIEVMKSKIRTSFIVDTLTYLYRGGRCSGVAALAGSALKLHPKIVVENGKMSPSKKYRGNISSSIVNYTKDMEDEIKNADERRIVIVHSGCSKDILDEAYSYIEGMNKFSEILVLRAGCVISSHCGPNTFGVIFMAK